MAEETTTKAGQSLSDDEKREIVRIALADGDEAFEAFSSICPPIATSPAGTVSDAVEALRGDSTFVGLAQLLRLNTILWLRIEGEEDDREIVKFAYDIPWDVALSPSGLSSYGLAPFVFQFETPHVGSTGSYHLNMTTPTPLQAIDSELVLYDASAEIAPEQTIDASKIRYKASPGHPIRSPYGDFAAYADVKGPRAKFYVAGKRHGLGGRVYVAVRLDIRGFLRSSSLGAALLAIVLGGFAIKNVEVAKNNNAAAAVLLVAPALLAFLLKPSEHVLIGGLLAGLRRLAILGGVWPLVASALVVVITPASTLGLLLGVLAGCELATAIGLALPLAQGIWTRGHKAVSAGG